MHTILIIGGGFGGVRLAQRLSGFRDVKVKLVDPKSYMQYYAANYRLATGGSALETCISYQSLLKNKNVEHVRDAIASVDPAAQVAIGKDGSKYAYDSLVVAVGSETSFFGIPGADQFSFGIRTADESLRLRNHMSEVFEQAKTAATPEEKTALLHFIVIGGGATGTELAGELPSYTKKLARIHGVDASLISIDLIEAMPRVLGLMSEKVSAKVLRRLQSLGVNVFLNRSVIREETGELIMKDMQMKSRTIIWTAGMKAAKVTGSFGLPLDKRGRIDTDEHMRARGFPNVYAIGDAASTKYSGMAQTAIADADHVARAIITKVQGGTPVPYKQPMPAYSVPVGSGWAATVYHGFTLFGRLGWMMRRAADLRAFLIFLPLSKALAAFRNAE